jgi:hypothetical protein
MACLWDTGLYKEDRFLAAILGKILKLRRSHPPPPCPFFDRGRLQKLNAHNKLSKISTAEAKQHQAGAFNVEGTEKHNPSIYSKAQITRNLPAELAGGTFQLLTRGC